MRTILLCLVLITPPSFCDTKNSDGSVTLTKDEFSAMGVKIDELMQFRIDASATMQAAIEFINKQNKEIQEIKASKCL